MQNQNSTKEPIIDDILLFLRSREMDQRLKGVGMTLKLTKLSWELDPNGSIEAMIRAMIAILHVDDTRTQTRACRGLSWLAGIDVTASEIIVDEALKLISPLICAADIELQIEACHVLTACASTRSEENATEIASSHGVVRDLTLLLGTTNDSRLWTSVLFVLASLSHSPRSRAVILGPENADRLVANLNVIIAKSSKSDDMQRVIARTIGSLVGGERASAVALSRLSDGVALLKKSKNPLVICEAEWAQNQLAIASAPAVTRDRLRQMRGGGGGGVAVGAS